MPMKKFLLPAIAVMFIYLSACNQPASSSNTSEEQQNLSADSTIGEAFRTGDISKIDSVVASDFIDHTERGDKNRDSLKAMIKMIHDSLPDMKMTTINRAASGDYVYSWMNYKGTSNGFMGMPREFDMHSIELVKYKDGKAVEHWGFLEARDIAKMMMPPIDTSKMKK